MVCRYLPSRYFSGTNANKTRREQRKSSLALFPTGFFRVNWTKLWKNIAMQMNKTLLRTLTGSQLASWCGDFLKKNKRLQRERSWLLKCLWSKKNCCLFETLFKSKKNGVLLLEIYFFVMEIITFLYCANEKSDDVRGGSTKILQHSITNISRIIKAVFFKLGTRNEHHNRKKMTPILLLPWQQLYR